MRRHTSCRIRILCTIMYVSTNKGTTEPILRWMGSWAHAVILRHFSCKNNVIFRLRFFLQRLKILYHTNNIFVFCMLSYNNFNKRTTRFLMIINIVFQAQRNFVFKCWNEIIKWKMTVQRGLKKFHEILFPTLVFTLFCYHQNILKKFDGL